MNKLGIRLKMHADPFAMVDWLQVIQIKFLTMTDQHIRTLIDFTDE